MRSSPADSFCLLAFPHYNVPEDTEETKRQDDEHNAIGEALCGW